MAKVELCRDRVFPTKHLTHLPHEYRISDHVTLVIDYACVDQLPICRAMIREAAERGDNVGTDEYEDEQKLSWLLSISEIFTAKDAMTGEIKAFIFIRGSSYIRGVDKSCAAIVVVRSRDLASHDVIFGELVRLAVQFSEMIDIGYMHCFVDVALCHYGLVRQLRQQRFYTAAIIPRGVHIAGLGLRENAIMCKDLALTDRPPRSQQELLPVLQNLIPKSVDITMSPINYLPKEYRFKCGVQAVFRNATHDDAPLLYKLMVDSSSRGQGFATNEFAHLNLFKFIQMDDSHCTVIEEADNGKLIGYGIIHSYNWFSRSNLGSIGDAILLVSEDYKGKGIGTELLLLQRALISELGIKSGIIDAFISNYSLLGSTGNVVGIIGIGTIPKSGYREGFGWEDSMVGIVNYADYKGSSFRQMLEENAKKFATSKI